jgi:hypothetical protein
MLSMLARPSEETEKRIDWYYNTGIYLPYNTIAVSTPVSCYPIQYPIPISDIRFCILSVFFHAMHYVPYPALMPCNPAFMQCTAAFMHKMHDASRSSRTQQPRHYRAYGAETGRQCVRCRTPASWWASLKLALDSHRLHSHRRRLT